MKVFKIVFITKLAKTIMVNPLSRDEIFISYWKTAGVIILLET